MSSGRKAAGNRAGRWVVALVLLFILGSIAAFVYLVAKAPADDNSERVIEETAVSSTLSRALN